MRLRKRKAFAAIVDALMFLAIASVVSLTLCVSYSAPEAEDTDISSLVAEVHRVLLGCEVSIEPEGEVLPSMKVSDLALMTAHDGKDALRACLAGKAGDVLDGLVPSSVCYSWSVVCGDATIDLSQRGVHSSDDVFVSRIVLSDGGNIESRLTMWHSLGREDLP